MPSPRFNPRQMRILGTGESVSIEPRRPRPPRRAEIGQLFPRETRVLGLDLAAVTTGWALFDGGKFQAAGSITLAGSRNTRETRPAFLLRRASVLNTDVKGLVEEYRPAVIAYEYADQARPVWSGGSKGREFLVAMALGQIEMALVIACARLDVVLAPVPLSAAKIRLCRRANASKGQVRDEVAARIGRGIVEQVTDDQSDACSIALAVLEGS